MGWTAILAVLAVSTSTASADDPDGKSRFAATPGFCAPKQAFGMDFGSREVPGIHMSGVSSLVTLPARFRPFSNAEVSVTMKGRRRHTVYAQADFDNERSADHALASVASALVAGGWITEPVADGRPVSFYSDRKATDTKHPAGRIVELFTLGSRLYFGCTDAAWKQRADREFPPVRPANPPR